MPVQTFQCNGITKTGNRCKIKVNSSAGFCHYHEHQSGLKYDSYVHYSAKKKSNNAGYIYMYTFTNFVINGGTPWSFQVQNLPDCSSRKKNKWVDFKAKKSPFILIKIGMTTKTVNTRLKEWESQCHHDITNLGPMNRHLVVEHESSVKMLISKFLNLNISSHHVINSNISSYRRYKDNGFYCKQNLDLVEQKIHQSLRDTYGKGDVYCKGCVTSKSPGKTKSGAPFPKFNTHKEFFLIPKKDIDSVYELIDSMCIRYG
ncbi:uncharacterized protein SPAPADRAFT_155740 [Spathaspora passalidarum NRRL Y-27907]|uniref:Bacteriophage T5 Orf172 DNA-binding domain-containing protein n=1 Tax=Spathaspora passalidarum (strain NRRL Y-27907 / 11-Y1) TaxID=619300 RepID=G3ASC8_SPAPN|nr:uncharacterized protein SPAPADRAFT_155740 [Spathaspora passalidarum NRRL Y-27907]EGW30668.1 hypothetical protein SPAPADRAFT_155740 [Spathaspora passalidarum NRRL Y-27907]